MVKKYLMLSLLVAGLSTQFMQANRTLRTARLVQQAARARQESSKKLIATPVKKQDVTPKQQEESFEAKKAAKSFLHTAAFSGGLRFGWLAVEKVLEALFGK